MVCLRCAVWLSCPGLTHIILARMHFPTSAEAEKDKRRGWFFVFLQLPFCLVRQTILSLNSASVNCFCNASSSLHLVLCLRRDSRKSVPYLRTKVISSSLVMGAGRIIEYRRTTLGQLSSLDNSGNNRLTLGRAVREVTNVRRQDKVNTVNLGLPKQPSG